MDFKDYTQKTITLSEDSLSHIQEQHPEISVEQIALALKEPVEVRKSTTQPDISELYYHLKSKTSAKVRFICVVVKNLPNGSFISTAMTTAKIKDGEIVYKQAAGKDKKL